MPGGSATIPARPKSACSGMPEGGKWKGGLAPNSISLEGIHKTFDRLFPAESRTVAEMGLANDDMNMPTILIQWGEVGAVKKTLKKNFSLGLDGLTVPELNKILSSILAHIFNKWLIFISYPLDTKISKAVFIPKKDDA